MRKTAKFLTWISLASLPLGFGAWHSGLLHSRAGAPESAPATAGELKIAEAPRAARGSAATPDPELGLTAEAESAARRLASAEQGVDSFIAHNVDPQVHERLASPTRIGQRLARVAATVRHTETVPQAAAKAIEEPYRADFIDHPEETADEIRGALERVDSLDFAEERIGLLSILKLLPGMEEDARELGLREVTTMLPEARPVVTAATRTSASQEEVNRAMSWEAQHVLPLLAYELFLNSTLDDPAAAMAGTIQAIVRQKDFLIRVGIAQGFINHFTELKPALYSELARREISLPELQPRSTEPRSPFEVVPPTAT